MKLLISFVVGGMIVAGTVALTKSFSPLVSALFLSYPISLITSYFIILWSHEHTALLLLYDTAKYAILGVVFMWIWYFALTFSHLQTVSITIASLCHLAIIHIVYKFQTQSNLF